MQSQSLLNAKCKSTIYIQYTTSDNTMVPSNLKALHSTTYCKLPKLSLENTMNTMFPHPPSSHTQPMSQIFRWLLRAPDMCAVYLSTKPTKKQDVEIRCLKQHFRGRHVKNEICRPINYSNVNNAHNLLQPSLFSFWY